MATANSGDESHGYRISVRGELPADIIEKVTSAHVRALSATGLRRDVTGTTLSEVVDHPLRQPAIDRAGGQ